MQNVATATLIAHDEAGNTSLLAWNGLQIRVPLASSVEVGAVVKWTLPSDQIRLPARSPRPQRADETAFRARLLDLRRADSQMQIRVAPLDSPDHALVLTVASEVVARKGIHVGDELVLRLRGDAARVIVDAPRAPRLAAAFVGGAAVGALGGLIGLGGAEFRLPLLIVVFGFAALSAVILNKAMSLVVVASALVFRAGAVPMGEVWAQWPVIVNLLAGSLVGAWIGAAWALRARAQVLYRVIAALLVCIAIVLVVGHDAAADGPWLAGWPLWVAGACAGLGIGVVASLLGVAGGELLIPTLVLLFGIDIRLAGSLSLAVSLPTMIVGFARYSRDRSFAVLGRNARFAITMAGGSVVGAAVGGLLLHVVPAGALLPLLAAILLWSAVKVWRHA